MWIVSGPSSVGKSTFIRSDVFLKLMGLNNTREILYPDTLVEKSDALSLSPDVVLHYNIIRPLRYLYFGKRLPKDEKKTLRARKIATAAKLDQKFRKSYPIDSHIFEIDPAWLNVAKMKERKIIEEKNMKSVLEQEEYPRDLWLDIYQKIDVEKLYLTWIKELERQKIDFRIFDSTSSSYEEIKHKSDIKEVIYRRGYGSR